MKYCLDIETTTDFSEIRLVGVYNDTKDKFFITCADERDEMADFLKSHVKPNSTVITYNGSKFDFPMIHKLLGFDMLEWMAENNIKHIDAYLISKLAFHDRERHSLESWGEEIGFPKTEVDYDHATLAELAIYCLNDCQLTLNVYDHMKAQVAKFAGGAFKTPLKLEQKVARLIAEQSQRGFPFDMKRAEATVKALSAKMERKEIIASSWLPWVPIPDTRLDKPPKVQFKKDGTLSSRMFDYLDRHKAVLWIEAGTEKKTVEFQGRAYSLPLTEPLITHEKLSLSDQTWLKTWLIKQGWRPTMHSPGGSPRLVDPVTKEPCPNLKHILSKDQVEQVSEWLMLRSRRNIIASPKGTGLIYAVKDGRIHHDADTLGANTGRFIHRTIVNIPRVSSPYGKELRELFIPSEGKVMVGWDAASLEARMEAHYVYPYDKSYAMEIIEGDIHTRNMENLGLPDRDMAKRFKYAVTYGARPRKLAEALGVALHAAEFWYNDFWKHNSGLTKLKSVLLLDWTRNKQKFITGLDGRLLTTRSEHSLLNTLLQGAGIIVMKYAMIIAEKRIKERFGDRANALIRYHDEEQWECDPDIAEEVGKIGVQSIVDAGVHLGLNVPLDGDWKVGSSWAETH